MSPANISAHVDRAFLSWTLVIVFVYTRLSDLEHWKLFDRKCPPFKICDSWSTTAELHHCHRNPLSTSYCRSRISLTSYRLRWMDIGPRMSHRHSICIRVIRNPIRATRNAITRWLWIRDRSVPCSWRYWIGALGRRAWPHVPCSAYQSYEVHRVYGLSGPWIK